MLSFFSKTVLSQVVINGCHQESSSLYLGQFCEVLCGKTMMLNQRHQNYDGVSIADSFTKSDLLQTVCDLLAVLGLIIRKVNIHPLVLFSLNTGDIPEVVKKRTRIKPNQLSNLLAGKPG